MITRQYKGYLGEYHFQTDDKTFAGKIKGISDLITFSAIRQTHIQTNFEEAVDDYLDTCKEINKEPDKVKATR